MLYKISEKMWRNNSVINPLKIAGWTETTSNDYNLFWIGS